MRFVSRNETPYSMVLPEIDSPAVFIHKALTSYFLSNGLRNFTVSVSAYGERNTYRVEVQHRPGLTKVIIVKAEMRGFSQVILKMKAEGRTDELVLELKRRGDGTFEDTGDSYISSERENRWRVLQRWVSTE